MEEKIVLTEEILAEKYNSNQELPKKIRLDASTICQLDCVCCYMRNQPDKVKNGCGIGYLKFENFRKLLDENDFEEIEISNNGEIFLNPDLVKIMAYAFQKRIRLTATNGVNLNYLTDEQAEALVKYRLLDITISLDGASQETYSQYRRGGNFDNVIKNIKKIMKYKQDYDSFYPKLNWKFIVFGHNEHEIDKAKKLSKDIGFDSIFFTTSWESEFSPIRNKFLIRKKTNITNLETPLTMLNLFKRKKSNWFYCKNLWEPQINWNGDVLGCCVNFSDKMGGNVFKDGFMNALNDPRLILAKNIVTGKAKPPKSKFPCRNCHVYKAMRNANHYLTSLK